MLYLIVEANDIAQLTGHVNEYIAEGWEPLGGLTAIRERVSGPITYFQAIENKREEPLKTSRTGPSRPRKK